MFHLVLGWLGAFLFAVCAVLQVIKTWRSKSAGDLSWLFLLFWLFGEVLTLVYIVIDDIIESITHYPLYINYVFNTILVFYLIYAKIAYREKGSDFLRSRF
jgi:uncharacterized protein with PQ loop repeat